MRCMLAIAAALVASTLVLPTWSQAQQQSGNKADVGQLRQRIDQLEEQLVEMQVIIGTLETLAKRGAGATTMPATNFAQGPSDDVTYRLNALESQIRVISEQLEQLGRRGAVAPPTNFGNAANTAPVVGGFSAELKPDQNEQPGFGSMTVTRGVQDDAIGRIIDRNQQLAAVAPPGSERAYEEAYGYMLQQNYGAAEAAFSDFLAQYAGDPLAGNAQYWLGESFFVRERYRQAAGAFLKGYKGYRSSPKAQESLLKLGMSLSRLGQKDSACTTFAEFSSKYPTAPSHIKQRAEVERKRAGC